MIDEEKIKELTDEIKKLKERIDALEEELFECYQGEDL